jgi:hypothetical protein
MRGAVITLGIVALAVALWQSFAPESSPVKQIDLEEEQLIASYLLEGTRRHFSEDGAASDVPGNRRGDPMAEQRRNHTQRNPLSSAGRKRRGLGYWCSGWGFL